jgi:hypothetical protein
MNGAEYSQGGSIIIENGHTAGVDSIEFGRDCRTDIPIININQSLNIDG